MRKLTEDRERRAENKRPRDWKKLWWAYVLHFIEGTISGAVALVSVFKNNIPLAVLAFSCVGMYIAYQGLSFARKRDSVGRDLSDFALGYAVAALVSSVWLYKGIALG